MHPLWKPRSKGVAERPYRFRGQGVMIAGNEKDGRVRAGVRLERPCQPLPEIWAGIRIVEDITNAEDRIDGVAPRDVQNSTNYIHAGP
jgi:hypothetical protein